LDCFKRGDMSLFNNFVKKTAMFSAIIGGTVLTGTMLLILINIVSRRFGFVILGIHELVELLMVIVVAGAVGYTELNKSHVTVSLVKGFFSERTKVNCERVISLIHLLTWGAVLVATVMIMVERWSIEVSEILAVPVFPFRIIWTYGLAFWCLVILMDFIKALKRGVK
jgi:TRAP-type C4-dicarboxylate transport system permease small subunit